MLDVDEVPTFEELGVIPSWAAESGKCRFPYTCARYAGCLKRGIVTSAIALVWRKFVLH